MVQFSVLLDAELNELVLEYMGSHGFTTWQTYLNQFEALQYKGLTTTTTTLLVLS